MTERKVCHSYLLIPVDLCRYAIKHRFIRPMQIYLLLKAYSRGDIRLDRQCLCWISKELHIKSVKTVRRNLRKLENAGWIHKGGDADYCFIKGFDRVHYMAGLNTRAGVKFEIDEINKIKSFACGAIICCLIRCQAARSRRKERLNGRSATVRLLYKKRYPLAVRLIGLLVDCPHTTACKIKQRAQHGGYIRVRKLMKKVPIGLSEVRTFKRANPEFANKIRIIKGKVYEQGIDQIKPNMHIKRRKKRESIYMGI